MLASAGIDPIVMRADARDAALAVVAPACIRSVEPEFLARVLAREGFAGAWVGHLPGAFHRDPVPSNRALYAAVDRWPQVLLPAPIVRPDWPGWQDMLRDAVNAGATQQALLRDILSRHRGCAFARAH